MKLLPIKITIAAAIMLIGVFVVLRLLSLSGDLAAAPPIERPGFIVPGLVLYGVTLLLYAALWRTVVCRLDTIRPPMIDSASVFCASWVGRYIPSGLPYVAGKFVMGMRIGHSKPALAASLLYENVLLVSVAVISASIVIPLALGGEGAVLLYVGAGLGAVAALAVLAPPVLQRIVSCAARLANKPPIAREYFLSGRGIAMAAAIAAVGVLFNGAAFAFVLGAFTHLDAREWLASAAIFNLAGAIGVAVLPVPSGLGVREAILIGLLQLFVPIEVAAASAVLMRLGGIAVDVLFGLAGAAVFAWRQREPAMADRVAQRRPSTP
ncbi:MAG: lysylphosphatidylglycerol synthase domain-containing protein [Dehalococcoidia bacterium]